MGRRGSGIRKSEAAPRRSVAARAGGLAAAAALALALSGCTGGAPAATGSPAAAPTSSATASTPAAPSTAPSASASSAPAAPSTGAPTCAQWTQSQAFDRWVGQVPPAFADRAPDPNTEWIDTSDYSGATTYDPCAELSWVVLGIRGATASSPYQIMLFHRGEYLGTGTLKAYGFFPKVARVDDASIEVVYTWTRPGECTACATGRSTAWFTWDPQAGRVVMTGDVPPEG